MSNMKFISKAAEEEREKNSSARKKRLQNIDNIKNINEVKQLLKDLVEELGIFED